MHQIVDNFLSHSDLTLLQCTLTDPFSQVPPEKRLSWKFQDSIVDGDKVRGKYLSYEKDNYMWNHTFYKNDPFHISDHIHAVQPILRKIPNLRTLLRCKANMYHRTSEKIHHSSHIDAPNPHLACIFMINNNNGITIIDSEVEVENVENRMIFFEGTGTFHHGTTATDTIRLTLNINYTPIE